ncbi:MAG: TIGR04452 family lipoprotein [bacterium]|nr:TIGR04452 family lipoprotein [bacterium]
MRVILLVAAIGLCLTQCLLLNSLDLAPGHVRGDEAKDIIRGRLHELLLLGVISNSLPIQAAGFASAELVGIDESAYYKELEVEECAEQILGANVAQYRAGTVSPLSVAAISVAACDLQPDSAIFDP